MTVKTLHNILPLVDRPSRYLGTEINTIKKDHSKVKLRFALAFPDLYEIGTSHFGLQILYHILNRNKEIAAERVFAPGSDMETYIRSTGIPLVSLESHRPLKRFDIIGFSLLYELNFTNILTILDLAEIPFFACQRDLSYPLVIAGGPCTCNPEPVADFFDAIVIGDGEEVIMDISRTWLKWKQHVYEDKEALLKELSQIKGVYIPSFFEAHYDNSGFQTLVPKNSNYIQITRAIVGNLDQAPFPDRPIVPYGKPVHDRLRLEVSRGCTRGCRFCQAGMIYRPVRERSPETLLDLSDICLAATGYEDISLLSLSTGDYGCIVPLMKRFMIRCAERKIAISFPSLRAGTLTPELMKLVKKVRKTGFTLAPEAGSQRLRDIINKNITKQEIVATVQDAFSLGWQVIKLYFMIGLPFETDDDLQALVDLIKDLRQIKSQNGSKRAKVGKIKLNVSITTFIPKPHTPFQWASQISLTESKEKVRWLREKLNLPGIHFKWQNPEASILEGFWARGDRRLSRLLVAAYEKGCKFDGWSDKFQYHLWEEAFADTQTDMDFYTTRQRDMTEPLPWDHIDTKIRKDFLKEEWKKSVNAQQTEDCRQSVCNNCGVCDFEALKPTVFKKCVKESEKPLRSVDIIPDLKDIFYKKLMVVYSKQDQAKYFGHLELVNIFTRALRRAEIPVKFTEGFHPKPRISFEDPLPVGLESLNEILYLIVPGKVNQQEIIKNLNEHLPSGLVVHDCRFAPEKTVRKGSGAAAYLVQTKEGFFDKQELDTFKKSKKWIVTRTNRKGKIKEVDLKTAVVKIEMLTPQTLQMILVSEPGKTERPFEVIKAIFSLSEEQIKQASIVKTHTV